MDSNHDKSPTRQVSRREFNAAFSAAVASAACVGTGTVAWAEKTDLGEADLDRLSAAVSRALAFLQSHGQAQDGSFAVQAGVGVTALVTTAILRHGRSSRDPLVAKSLRHIEKYIKPDGGIYSTGGMLANYETCLAMMCLKEANDDSQYNLKLRAAEEFVRGYQWDEANGRDAADAAYGGAGYGKHKRPDLSNTAFMIDALKECGASESDPAIQKALIFISRCQNLESENNTTIYGDKVNDGGFYYTCAAGGKSPAGMTLNGGLRSYASMTYSGLKSMVYAGLGPDDPRVKAAIEWIRANYDLKSNPGMGSAGLYYYYHTFAKTLDVFGVEQIDDATGTTHDWRFELTEELLQAQRPNGSWLNENERWMEGDPNLATAYALLALSHCRHNT